MTRDDVVDVLTAATAYDRRTVGEADIAAWAEVIGHLPRADALAAVVAHYAASREWLMPADVIGRVRAVHARRLGSPMREPDPRALGVDPDDAPACRAALLAWRRAVAAGAITHQPAEIEG